MTVTPEARRLAAIRQRQQERVAACIQCGYVHTPTSESQFEADISYLLQEVDARDATLLADIQRQLVVNKLAWVSEAMIECEKRRTLREDHLQRERDEVRAAVEALERQLAEKEADKATLAALRTQIQQLCDATRYVFGHERLVKASDLAALGTPPNAK